MQLIDTHTHPHMRGYELEPSEFLGRTKEAGVAEIICIGTDGDDSHNAIEFAKEHGGWASVGLHPHEASRYFDEFPKLKQLLPQERVVAIGECGLDYHYMHSTKEQQQEALHAQINLAKQHGLPLVFHVRDAFEDFFDIFDMHQNITGVVHSFTADSATMEACTERGLMIGVNGIATFAKDPELKQAIVDIGLESLVLETDAPFLTPEPYRGTINHSGHTRVVAEYIANIRGESLESIAQSTTQNARKLFSI